MIIEIPAAQTSCPSVCSKCEVFKKETNCDNVIAEIGEEKKIVAMSLPKMGGEKKIVVAEIWGGIKKKMLRSQYFYNIFTTNYR